MPKVKKGNRILRVSEVAVKGYLKKGYDEIDDKGKVVKKATGGKTVSIGLYNKVLEENEKLKEKNEKLKEQLKENKKDDKKKEGK